MIGIKPPVKIAFAFLPKSYERWGHTPNRLYYYNDITYSKLASTDVSLSATYTIRYGRKQQDQRIEGVTNDQSLMR